MRVWHPAHIGFARCFSICCRIVPLRGPPFASIEPTPGGGGGGGAFSTFSKIHFPRNTGEVRVGYEAPSRTLACFKPPLRSFPSSATRRKFWPFTSGPP